MGGNERPVGGPYSNKPESLSAAREPIVHRPVAPPTMSVWRALGIAAAVSLGIFGLAWLALLLLFTVSLSAYGSNK